MARGRRGGDRLRHLPDSRHAWAQLACLVFRPAKSRNASGSRRADLHGAGESTFRQPRESLGRSAHPYRSCDGARRARVIAQTPASVNARANELVTRLVADAAELGLAIAKGSSGETLIDAGSKTGGGIEAGLRIARICLGGLADVNLLPSQAIPRWPWVVAVRSSLPVIACLASQYAGWRLAHGKGKDAFVALGSGPARALARSEKLFADLTYADRADRAVMVIESDRAPPPAIVAEVASACGLPADRLTFIFMPTQSRAGSVQIVARVLEVALHKAHELGFPLERMVEGMGAAPLPPPHPDFVRAMGRTNDAIIYAGEVHLFVQGPAEEAKTLAERMPSSASRDYGRPFAEIFKRVNGDFYAIDPMLFSPASVIVTALETGDSFHAGALAPMLLDASFT
ncbi:MAG: methenyltetrahydromethanopterin cyclohydrolase [Hyphomicrobiales bacterium]|nr:methenyltetrahydromethanopterin cyclohydrolase [Hyphomicrobiales bacterium]